MISALYRYSKQERSAVAKQWAKRSHAVQSTARIARGPDAETLRRRALHDARGQLLRHGHTYRGATVIEWRIVRSIRGRTDQVDVLINGRHRFTISRRWVRRYFGIRFD